jgi:hypothetical protein
MAVWKTASRRAGRLVAILAWLICALPSSSHAQSDINLAGYTVIFTFYDAVATGCLNCPSPLECQFAMLRRQ